MDDWKEERAGKVPLFLFSVDSKNVGVKANDKCSVSIHTFSSFKISIAECLSLKSFLSTEKESVTKKSYLEKWSSDSCGMGLLLNINTRNF